MGKEHREGQEAKDRVHLQPDTAHTPAQLPSYSSEPHKANKNDYWHPEKSIFSHSDSVPCRPQAGSLQTYPASSKAVARVPNTLEAHIT